MSKTGHFLIVNDAYSDMIGYSPSEMSNFTYIDITHKDDLQKDVEQANSVASGEIKNYNMEKRYICKDGSVVWVHLYVNGIFDDNNKFLYHVVHAMRIGKFKQQTNIVSLATDAAEIGIWEWDEATDQLTWNDQMYSIYGVEKDKELVYEDWISKVLEEDREEAEKEITSSMDNGHKFNTKFRIKIGDKIKYIKANADKSGSTPNKKMVGCNIDITDMAEVQELLKQSNEDLEKFAYLASHDLKAPLRSIQKYTELINKRYGEKLDDNGRYLMETVISNTKEMQTMIESMLQLCRLSTETIMNPVNLNDVWEDVLDHFCIDKNKERINIKCDMNTKVMGSREQLRHVFQNLLSNSIKYRKKRGDLNIEVKSEEKEDFILVSFEDNGIGIEKKRIKNLFMPYVKNVKVNINQSRKGNGLGLYICSKIMNNHKGNICVSSELDKGSTFHLTFNKV